MGGGEEEIKGSMQSIPFLEIGWLSWLVNVGLSSKSVVAVGKLAFREWEKSSPQIRLRSFVGVRRLATLSESANACLLRPPTQVPAR